MSQDFINKEDVLKEIDIFEKEIMLRKQGVMDEKVFAETRLRRGVYGQRYDNGQRYDGFQTRELNFPSGDLEKGTGTAWDAPGMMRIKIPFGSVTPEQLDVLAELAEEYSDSIVHVTTRQDFQLHFVHIENTPAIMRRLANVGITTREACGNSVRNVTACSIAGVCRDEAFDVTPYSKALAQFLLGHPDTQDFGRKFKISFSGCQSHACGLASIHDFSAVAKTRVVDGIEKRGFTVLVGGGLGAVPHQAKLYDEFLLEEELLPLAQAISKVFARHGEKKNRARARVKFLIQSLGVDAFKALVVAERKSLAPDPTWTNFLKEVNAEYEKPFKPAGSIDGDFSNDFKKWFKSNVYEQKQGGYATITMKLPLGDMSAQQTRQLAAIARRFTEGTLRTTVEQNIVLRWVSKSDVPAVYEELKSIQLAAAGASTIEDITACPGTDTCKLGIASSRGLASELQKRFAEGFLSVASNGDGQTDGIDEVIRKLHIKISGCFNSCGQHHIADIGFYGVSRKVGSYTVPHFQVVLGGQWQKNAGSYGLAIGAIPSKRAPYFLRDIVSKYKSEKSGTEPFQTFIKRIGKVEIKGMLQKYLMAPTYEQDRGFYSDWRDPREFTLGDMGIGECAGEVVSQVEFGLAAAERIAFEAQIALENNEAQKAGESAYKAMLKAAHGLVANDFPGASADANSTVTEFKERFVDTEIFFDRFAGGKFARYLFNAHEFSRKAYDHEKAHRTIEEAQLFIEAAYSCYLRIQENSVPA